MSSIEELKGAVTSGGGIAIPSLFKVYLPTIAGKTGASVGGDALNLICKSVELPGRQISSIDYQTGTATRKIANGYLVPDINLVFYCMNDHKITRYFDEWQRLAHDPEYYTVGYFDDYGKDVTIEQLQKGAGFSAFKKQLGFMDKIPQSIKNRLPDLGIIDFSSGEIDITLGSKDRSVRKVKLEKAYPTSVNAIQLGNDQEGITEITVQLSFKDWIPYTSGDKDGADGPSSGIGDAILGGVLGSLLN